MSKRIGAAMIPLFIVGVACSQAPPQPSASEAGAGIDSLNARLEQAYRNKDPRAYAALYTDSAVFEWPASNSVRGPAGLEAMARELWPPLNDLDLKLTVASRKVAPDHATEFGAFEESWRDPKGVRMAEYGRYVVYFVRQGDGRWRIDRFFGFEDSARKLPARP
jgi:ketosteroid isomerase-like protein